jgi:hydrocephalus-inducing protein
MKTSTQSSLAMTGPKPLIKSLKKVPSQLIKDQSSGKSIIEQFPKPKIIQFLNIGDNSIHTDSQVHVDEPLFAPIPHVIQFTNYEPLQTKTAVLTLRNKDRVARSIKIIPPDSKLFTVTPAKKSMVTSKKANATMGSTVSQASDIDQMSTKVAPGMDITYIIKFSPVAKSDYAYDLMVMTEREKFIVPIRARGCRAMLDFPDQLDFGLVPVKYETEKPVMIRNIGEKTTKWQITVPSGFKVDKNEGILDVG